jgi:GT2 family glycosyltransferase
LDEGYVAYGEEDDFEKRAMRAGYKLARVNLPIWHYSMGSFGRVRWRASWLAMRNTIRCSIKNEGPGDVLRQVARVANWACNPFAKVEMDYFHFRRLRPSNVVVNGFVLGGALLWNLASLPQTLGARKRAEERISGATRGEKAEMA